MKLSEFVAWAVANNVPDDAELVMRTRDDELVWPLKKVHHTPDPFSESFLVVLTPNRAVEPELVPLWGEG